MRNVMNFATLCLHLQLIQTRFYLLFHLIQARENITLLHPPLFSPLFLLCQTFTQILAKENGLVLILFLLFFLGLHRRLCLFVFSFFFCRFLMLSLLLHRFFCFWFVLLFCEIHQEVCFKGTPQRRREGKKDTCPASRSFFFF